MQQSQPLRFTESSPWRIAAPFETRSSGHAPPGTGVRANRHAELRRCTEELGLKRSTSLGVSVARCRAH